MKRLLQKTLLLSTYAMAVMSLCGCNSIARTHHERLERIYHTQNEIIEISKKLQDIEQTMLYVGRIKDGALANAALDIAIAIHGEPDDFEKKYAERVTMESIATTKVYAMDLVKQRAVLESLARKEKKKTMEEAYAMYAQEIRHNFLKQLVSMCTIAVVCFLVILFLKARI